MGRSRSHGASRPAGQAPRQVRRRRDRRLFRPAPRAHALPDRVRTGRRRGEGRRQLRTVPGRRGRDRRARRFPVHDPGPPRSAGLPAGAGVPRLRVALAGDRRDARCAADRGRGRVHPPRPVAEARRGRARRRARTDRGLARGGPGDQGAGRARAHRRGLCRGRPRADDAAPGHPGRRHRARPGAASRMADADRWRRGAGLRRRLPVRSGGGTAARLTGRSAGA